jgi:protein-tyrosine phosphatase
VFQVQVDQRGLSDRFELDSAGTASWHIGKSPDPRTQKHAFKRSYDLSKLTARQVALSDFQEFDYILAMDRSNLENLQDICPDQYLNKLKLFLEFSDCEEDEVPDPYYGGSAGFDHVLDLVESAGEGFFSFLASEAGV